MTAAEICAKNLKPVESNRLLFPQCSVWIDDLKKHFGEVRVRYVKELGGERGRLQGPKP